MAKQPKKAKKSKAVTKNIYRQTREKLGLSRAEAILYIPDDPAHPGMDGIAEYRLVRIEDGSTPVQPADVVAMAKRYNEPTLRNYYCCHECPIGRLDAPEVTKTASVHEVLTTMAVSLRNANHQKIRLMEILGDGQLSADEVEDFRRIAADLENISRSIEALQLWCEKMNIQ